MRTDYFDGLLGPAIDWQTLNAEMREAVKIGRQGRAADQAAQMERAVSD